MHLAKYCKKKTERLEEKPENYYVKTFGNQILKLIHVMQTERESIKALCSSTIK